MLNEPRITKRKRICGVCSKVIGRGGKYHPTSGRKTGAFRDRAICIQCGDALRHAEKILKAETEKSKGLVF